MSAYHQMGHDTWNLVGLTGLEGFGGIVMSPVNCTPEETAGKLAELGKQRAGLDIILDPQLYKPNSEREKLAEWPHFSEDVETMDLAAESWWTERCEYLVEVAKQVGADTVASPAIIPRVYSDEYYDWTIGVAQILDDMVIGSGLKTMITAIVSLDQLATPDAAVRIATFLTRPGIGRVYLVFKDEIDLKRQRSDDQALAGACNLIRLLETNGVRVLVAFSGLDLVLWKGAGATDAASGKFLNLRRFVPGRWEDPKEGGRVVPYWTDSTLLGWLREQDVRNLLRRRLIDPAVASRNPFSAEILGLLAGAEAQPWLGLSWRQYMRWFADTEGALSTNARAASSMLSEADAQWARIEESGLLMTDRAANGAWIRSWSNALLMS